MKLNKRNKLVYGVGVNDADYNVYTNGLINGKRTILWTCPFYARWIDVLKRSYSESLHKRFPTYVGCCAVDEWHLFSNFKAWMLTQNWEGKHLDKDLLVRGNKEYGPKTCIFVSPQVNTFLTECAGNRKQWLIGVTYDPKWNNFMARCQSVVTGKNKTIGRFKTELEAHQAWLAFKLKQAYILAEQQTDKRVADALVYRYENYSLV